MYDKISKTSLFDIMNHSYTRVTFHQFDLGEWMVEGVGAMNLAFGVTYVNVSIV